ncbi:MAG: lamin tail domain-containing protein [Tissierellales bacterium]|nr:lamin tail domain-containing protein [Tissierellales bacterium]
MKKIVSMFCCLLLLISVSAKADEWIDYGNVENVDLNYVWKVEFNNNVGDSQIEHIELNNFQRSVDFDISYFENVAKIDALKPYLPGVEYIMKLHLNDNKKYRLKFTATKSHDGEGLIHFLDLKNGRAVLFQMPDGQNVLLDTGSKADSKDVLKYMKNLGIKQLDVLMLSDEDPKFSGGAVNIMESVPAKRILIGNFKKGTGHISDLKGWAISRNLEVERYSRGDVFSFEDAKLKILKGTDGSGNNSSVLLYSQGNMQSLIFGLMNEAGIKELLERHEFRSIETVSIVEDYISENEMSFIKSIGAKYLVLQSSYYDIVGGIDVQSLDRLFEEYIVMYRPDIMGSVVTRTKGNRFSWMPQPWLPHLSRGKTWNSKIVIEKIDRKEDLVYIKNYGDESVELTDWYLKSENGGEKYVFGKGKLIRPNERIVIRSHVSKNFSDSNVLNWTNLEIWDDDGPDMGKLYDSHGNLISQYPYKW